MQTNNSNSLEKQTQQATIPQAVLKFTRGLDEPPEIFPLADTFEQAREVEKFLERKLLRDG